MHSNHTSKPVLYAICALVVVIIIGGTVAISNHHHQSSTSAPRTEQHSSYHQLNPKRSATSWRDYQDEIHTDERDAVNSASSDGKGADDSFLHGAKNPSFRDLCRVINSYTKAHHADRSQIYDGYAKIGTEPSFMKPLVGRASQYFQPKLIKTPNGYAMHDSIVYNPESGTKTKHLRIITKDTVFFTTGSTAYEPSIEHITFGHWVQ